MNLFNKRKRRKEALNLHDGDLLGFGRSFFCMKGARNFSKNQTVGHMKLYGALWCVHIMDRYLILILPPLILTLLNRFLKT